MNPDERAGGKGPRKARKERGLSRSPGFWTIVAIVVLVISYLAALEASRPHVTGDKLRLDSFNALVESGRVETATVLDVDRMVVGVYEREEGGAKRRYYVPIARTGPGAIEFMLTLLLPNNVDTSVNQQLTKRIAGPATTVLPALLLVIVIAYFLWTTIRGGGFGRSGRGSARIEEAPVTFDDVAGQDTAVMELREIADFLSDSERYADVGAQIPRGVLLFGPPGCGKTLMARALAGESGAAFYSISGSDFVEMYVGVGARRVRDLFKEAREDPPAIVFIDELDSVGRRRAGSGPATQGAADEQGHALNQLLAEIDGFSPTQGVIVVGATNRPDVLDPALLRPGRFDRAVGLELPDEKGRRAILAVHARGKPVAPDVDMSSLARDTVGMTGADLASVVNEGALLAARARRTEITVADLDEALERVRDAPEQQRRLSMRDRRMGQSTLHRERLTFADVAGMDDVIEELAEVREYLADRTRFERLGARMPTGYLLDGPPGTGKTLLANALAGESNAAFISVAGTEFTEVFVGEGAARMRDLFAQARGVAPSIVFIDEIDAVGARRQSNPGDSGERAQTLNQLLVELDICARTSTVVVMAATNRPEMLDSALTRPGRFDRRISIDMPDLEARRQILELHARERPMADDIDLDALARLTYGLAGADLNNLLNEAALLAARRGAERIDRAEIDEAMDRIGLGIARARQLSDEDRRIIAYHEAGHGLVARALPGGRILHKISIVARANAAGVTWIPETGDRRLHTRTFLVERMATLLGGRAAEDIVFGEIADGAAHDLARVGLIARRMVTVLGMSDAVGAMSYADENGPNGVVYSDETARLIDDEARRLVGEADAMARRVLREQRSLLDRVADALLERETLTLDEVDEIAGPAAVAPA
ncbi:MAG TPA: AAA family ATPase [Solirubrobacteraceae bacterium]|nr:AAA family ATPase [Solirubrobacteraceae bacterium]